VVEAHTTTEGEHANVQSVGRDSIRIGIDVGGTFTHAVAIDAESSSIVGKVKVPTSHRAAEGVARGIVEALQKLLHDSEIGPERVSFIAHSTTQATNALLEGDLAKVGIIGLGSGANALLAAASTRLGKVPVASGCYLETEHVFFNTDKGFSEETARAAINDLLAKGCGAIAVSEAFAPDQADHEELVMKVAAEMKVLATAGAEVSQLYGLKVRTRTAAINAGILPKMIESADLTESSVRAAGIQAPIMIMRSDGGVMDIAAMRKRPILSILSGPAAGVAAAMMFLRVSDGIFLEVGGTSTDISAIANGRALIRSAEIGGHRIYMRTLDVRTVGVAGGSMPRLSASDVVAVGPRSAHIAGLGYASFSDSADGELEVKQISPLKKDPADYLALVGGQDKEAAQSFTITPTCAANLLDLVPADNCAKAANKDLINRSFKALARKLGRPDDEGQLRAIAEKIETLAAAQCLPVVKALIAEHKLDGELVNLIGGGGGAAAIVPYLAKEMNLRFEIAEHADVISAIGVAMALIRETIERQVSNTAAANETIIAMREEVFEAVHKMGADPATIEVHVEIDSKTSIVRATASGANKLHSRGDEKKLSNEERLNLVADSMRVAKEHVISVCATDYFAVFQAERKSGGILGFMSASRHALRILDQDGVLRLQAANGEARLTTAGGAEATIIDLIEAHALWGDAGKTIPGILLLSGTKIIDLSGLLDQEQVIALARAELANFSAASQVIVVARIC
jgi:N-methylhydantoinase A